MGIKELGKALNDKVKDYNLKAGDRRRARLEALKRDEKALKLEEEELTIKARIEKRRATLEKLRSKPKKKRDQSGIFDLNILGPEKRKSKRKKEPGMFDFKI